MIRVDLQIPAIFYHLSMWIGPAKDWEAVFEFEGEHESANSDLEEQVRPAVKHEQPDAAFSRSRSPSPSYDYPMIRSVKHMSGPTWLYWTILSIALHYFLYHHIFA